MFGNTPNGQGGGNQLGAFLRMLRQRQDAMDAELRKIGAGLLGMHKAVGDAAGQLKRIAEYGKGFEPLEWEALARQADRVVPFWYTEDLTFAAAATTMAQGVTPVLAKGYFLMTRISVTTRPTEGTLNGCYRPVSSGNPVIAGSELQAGAQVADKIDFTFRYETTNSNQYRQWGQFPGDLFYRIDGDVVLPIPDIIEPAADIVCEVTPTQAMDHACIVSVTYWGMQALNVLEAQQ